MQATKTSPRRLGIMTASCLQSLSSTSLCGHTQSFSSRLFHIMVQLAAPLDYSTEAATPSQEWLHQVHICLACSMLAACSLVHALQLCVWLTGWLVFVFMVELDLKRSIWPGLASQCFGNLLGGSLWGSVLGSPAHLPL